MMCFALLGAASTLLGCGDNGPPTNNYELSGVITDEMTGRRLSGVAITFTSDTLYSENTTTDGDGEYEMLVETDATFGQVRAEKEGYRSKETSVFFDSPIRRIDLALVPDGRSSE